jgi:hypothetical protein
MGEVARERFGILHCTIQPEVGGSLPSVDLEIADR